MDGVMSMPWVFLHGIKDYYEMPWLLSLHKGVKASFNITAPLIEQLNLYKNPLKNDYFLSLWASVPKELEEKQRTWLIKTCKSTQYETMVKPIEYFRLLYDKELVGIFSNGTISVEPKYQRIGEFSEGLASFQNPKTKKYGFLDQTGKIIIPATFEFAGTFSEGLAAVRTTSTKDREKSVIGFINRQGAMKIAPNLSATTAENPDFSQNFVQFHEGICFIPNRPYHDGKYVSSGSGYINKSGQWVEHHVITEAYPFKAGQALVRYYPKSGK